jgi:hypothetical protein
VVNAAQVHACSTIYEGPALQSLDRLQKVADTYAAIYSKCLSALHVDQGDSFTGKAPPRLVALAGHGCLRILITELGGGEGKAEATMCR